VHDRAANLRRMFSAIVAANVRAQVVKQVEALGSFEICGDPKLMVHIDTLLTSFVKEKRMTLSGDYRPVYRPVLVTLATTISRTSRWLYPNVMYRPPLPSAIIELLGWNAALISLV
jgi:hypothetical protein